MFTSYSCTVFMWVFQLHTTMAYSAEQVVSLLNTSFQGEDSSDDDFGFEIEMIANAECVEGPGEDRQIHDM